MRIFTASVLCSTVLLLTVAQAAENKSRSQQPTQTTDVASQETVNLAISGMTGPINCPKRVRSALTSVAGVVDVEVTFPDKAVVKVEKGKVKTDQMIKALKKAGYTAKAKKESGLGRAGYQRPGSADEPATQKAGRHWGRLCASAERRSNFDDSSSAVCLIVSGLVRP